MIKKYGKREKKGKIEVDWRRKWWNKSDYISLYLNWRLKRASSEFLMFSDNSTSNLVELFLYKEKDFFISCCTFFSLFFVIPSIHHIKGIIIKHTRVQWNRINSTYLLFQSFAFNTNSIRIILPNVDALDKCAYKHWGSPPDAKKK